MGDSGDGANAYGRVLLLLLLLWISLITPPQKQCSSSRSSCGSSSGMSCALGNSIPENDRLQDVRPDVTDNSTDSCVSQGHRQKGVVARVLDAGLLLLLRCCSCRC